MTTIDGDNCLTASTIKDISEGPGFPSHPIPSAADLLLPLSPNMTLSTPTVVSSTHDMSRCDIDQRGTAVPATLVDLPPAISMAQVLRHSHELSQDTGL